MTVRIVIPVRAPAEGKSRLAASLTPDERRALNHRFLDHVLAVALAVSPSCAVISGSAEMRARAAAAGAAAIAETGDGLNAALLQAAQALAAEGDGPILALSADLPWLDAEDLRAMLAAGAEAEIVAACDSAGTGTNALLQRRPLLIPYRFGPGSFAAHRAAAAKAGLAFAAVRRFGLERDIDTPEELAELKASG